MLHRKGIHSVLNKKYLLLQLAGFIGLLLVACLIVYFSYQRSYNAYTETSKTLRFNYTLSNITGEFITNVDFSIKIPMAIDAIQNLESIKSSYKSEVVKEDNERSIVFSIDNISPYASKLIDLTLVINTSDRPKRERINSVNYLTSEKYIELDSPAVKSLAAQLKGSSPEETAKNIYEWLVSNITSLSYTAESKGAQYLIEKKSGDCTEFAYAFVALARANGLPARGVRGFWVPTESTIINAADYHDWAEFHDGKQWILVDAQKQVFASDYMSYLSIANLTDTNQNAKRFSVSHDSIRVSFQ